MGTLQEYKEFAEIPKPLSVAAAVKVSVLHSNGATFSLSFVPTLSYGLGKNVKEERKADALLRTRQHKRNSSSRGTSALAPLFLDREQGCGAGRTRRV
jgi:hypothetical protein